MPRRRAKSSPSAQTPAGRQLNFRQRYDELETRRAELCARLRLLGKAAEDHPAYKAALKLLNNIYRKEKLTQRLAVLQSAAWLIDILERLADML